MIKTIRFYKNEEGHWYADLPEWIEQGGSIEECQMVSGADQWLDIISDYAEEVTLKVSNLEPLSEKISRWYLEESNPEFGAYYAIGKYKEKLYPLILWLCPVTLFVFGEYPETIYYETI